MKLDEQHPMEKAVTLLEYVSKTKGAKHLMLGSRYLSFVQYHSLDVFAATLVSALIVCLAPHWLHSYCTSRG
jgi:hypothetical protein